MTFSFALTAHAPAASRRKNAAHGASRGMLGGEATSPAGAEETNEETNLDALAKKGITLTLVATSFHTHVMAVLSSLETLAKIAGYPPSRPEKIECGKPDLRPRISPVIARDTTCSVSLLTGTIGGSNFAFPSTKFPPNGKRTEFAGSKWGIAQPEVTRLSPPISKALKPPEAERRKPEV